jgi:hypothetical protein
MLSCVKKDIAILDQFLLSGCENVSRFLFNGPEKAGRSRDSGPGIKDFSWWLQYTQSSVCMRAWRRAPLYGFNA